MKKYFIKECYDDKSKQSDKGSASSSREIKASSADFAAGKSYRGVLQREDDHDFESAYKKRKVDFEEKYGIKIIEPSPDKTNETIGHEVRKNFIAISNNILEAYTKFDDKLYEDEIYNHSGGFSLEEYNSLTQKFENSTKIKDANSIIEKMKVWLDRLNSMKDANTLEILEDFNNTYEMLKNTYDDTSQLFDNILVMNLYNQRSFPQKEYNSLTQKFEEFKKSTEIEDIKNITNEMKMFISKLNSAHEAFDTLKGLRSLSDMCKEIKHTYNTLLYSLEETEIFKRSGILPETYKSLMVAHDSIMSKLRMTVKDFKKIHIEPGWNTDLVQSALEATEQGEIMLDKLDKLKEKVEQSRQQHRIWEKRLSQLYPN
jgi:hypothetical protein